MMMMMMTTTTTIRLGRHYCHHYYVFLDLLLLLFGVSLFFSTTATAAHQLSPAEQFFLTIPNATTARTNLRYITSKPHVAGTAGDYQMAHFVHTVFAQQAGIPNVTTFELDVLLNYPLQRPHVSVRRRRKKRHPCPCHHHNNDHNDDDDDDDEYEILYQANLTEPVLPFDDTSNQTEDWNAYIFHGYGASGTVTAPVVFANYGRPADFDALLATSAISVQGCIVLMRYGKCFRGLKVMNAQRRGALGVLLYSDPAEDGYIQGATYPAGPWRPAAGIQRGSVQFNSYCAGDPMRADARYHKTTNSTTNTAATASASAASNNMTMTQQICGVRDYTELIPSIPSVPMGYQDALSILQYLSSSNNNSSSSPVAKDVFEDFVGGLPIPYHVGPSPADTVVHLSTEHSAEIKSVPNVIGYIPGTLPPEQDMPVLLGNHRDAWVFGAADPNSGTVGLLEVARGLGALLDAGWKPKRSIYLLSWSGEEYGLLGSTGWAELNADKIQNAVAYLNADTLVSGDILSVAATPALVTLWEQVLDDLHMSGSAAMSFANAPRGLIRDANTNQIFNQQHPQPKTLGSGSDYTVFLDHFGISSLDFSFGKSTTYGQYHSIYDSFSWMDAFGGRDKEPGSAFSLIALGAQIWGLLALRLADSVVLPLDHVLQGKALYNYTKVIEEQNFTDLDLSNLKEAVHHFCEAANVLHAACLESELSWSPEECNNKLGLVERKFLTETGLPDRPWFKHTLQAPGMYLGYAADSFPGTQQAIDANDIDLAREQVAVAASCVEKAAYFLSNTASTSSLEKV